MKSIGIASRRRNRAHHGHPPLCHAPHWRRENVGRDHGDRRDPHPRDCANSNISTRYLTYKCPIRDKV
ncbi:hypothetical protein SUS17_3632 [Sphingomonas sp. S17]|nr:hypothetical protein SUS17_3632 [Sphingomonas sp. S17]